MVKSPLYDRAILRLSAALYRWPLGAEDSPIFMTIVEQRSPICGSAIKLGIMQDETGRIAKIGMDVQACALGQASAAIFAANAIGLNAPDVAHYQQYCRDMLNGAVPKGDALSPDMTLLERAAPYPARHGAIMLPYMAALAALSEHPTSMDGTGRA